MYQYTMLRWLLGTSDAQTIHVALSPLDEAARSLPGFHTGVLTLTATVGETIEQVMNRFNKYRGPDSQIHTVFTSNGDIIPLFTILTKSITLFIKNMQSRDHSV